METGIKLGNCSSINEMKQLFINNGWTNYRLKFTKPV